MSTNIVFNETGRSSTYMPVDINISKEKLLEKYKRYHFKKKQSKHFSSKRGRSEKEIVLFILLNFLFLFYFFNFYWRGFLERVFPRRTRGHFHRQSPATTTLKTQIPNSYFSTIKWNGYAKQATVLFTYQ